MNIEAQNLGRMGRGKKKTMTRAAISQRRKAAKISGRRRLKNRPRRGRPPQPKHRSAEEIFGEAYAKLPDPVRESAPAETEPDPSIEKKDENTSCNESASALDSWDERKRHLA
jgi:hypothetical protein